MNRQNIVLASLILLAPLFPRADAQATAGSVLHVEIINSTFYIHGYCAPSDMGKDTSKLPPPASVPALTTGIGIMDIVSVNGQPVKGTGIEAVNGALLGSAISPGRAIGDFAGGPTNTSWELTFMNLDNTLIGTLQIEGHGNGPRPPDAPKEISGSAYTVTGGTGAFFGARGYFQPVQDTVSGERRTTDCEDPAYRRVNADSGGNKRHPILYLVPMSPPQVIMTANGAAIAHASDFSPVTVAKPAMPSEILSLFATGLGPTRPGVDPGQPFPGEPAQVVNSPVDVIINGKSAEVLGAVGYPGTVNGYQVNFRMPPDVTSGTASIQISTAWIVGPAVSIAVQ
jgi:hypothetical protein